MRFRDIHNLNISKPLFEMAVESNVFVDNKKSRKGTETGRHALPEDTNP